MVLWPRFFASAWYQMRSISKLAISCFVTGRSLVARSHASIERAAFLPWPTAVVTVRSNGTMSPPANTPAQPVCMSGPTMTVPSFLNCDAGDVLEEAGVGVLAEREDQRIGLERLELAGRLREALLVQLHPLHRERRAVDLLDGAQPVDLDALFDGLVGFEVVRGHLLAGAAVDDERLVGAKPLRRARGIHGGVAAAVDRHAAADVRLRPRRPRRP